MRVTHFTDVTAFREIAVPFLSEREAENNLILGVSAQIAGGQAVQEAPYFATVHDDDRIVLAVMRTPPLNVVLSMIADNADMVAVLRAVVDDVYRVFGDDVPGANGDITLVHPFARLWCEKTERASEVDMKQRIYKLTNLRVPDVPGTLRRINADDADLLREWLPGFYADALLPDQPNAVIERSISTALDPNHPRELHLWMVDGQPVSLAGFGGPTPNGMRVGPVYTPKAFRKRGYGGAVTAGVTKLLLDRGRKFTFLYTDLDNPTSNKIYQDIGYQKVSDVDVVRFIDG